MAFEELKQRQSVMWGSGPFEQVEDTIADMHDVLVERLVPRPGERWLDIGSGTGAVAMRAARAGADVTGVDLAPDLVETARRRAQDEGLSISYDVGDCEQLPYAAASFDVVASSVGIMFAPDHEAVARELKRVVRVGGRLGITAWRAEGGIGDMFNVMKPFQPPPPDSIGNQFDWGREEYVSKLLGDAFELEFQEEDSVLEAESGQAVWQLFVDSYGPTKALADSLDEDRRRKLERAFVELHDRVRNADGIHFSRTYLLTLGTRR
jgi:SAM-dependent methyltransferase